MRDTPSELSKSLISERLYSHLTVNNILPSEQKGCRKATQGCKDQLLINKMIIDNSKTRKCSLSTAWVDYKKAFDSVPHSWILKTLDIYKVNPVIQTFLGRVMKQWKTEMSLNHSTGSIKTNQIAIKRGIFQGDSLSPLLFCLSLVPLTNILNREKIGYEITKGKTITHLLYMDDLKLYAKNDDQLRQELCIVKGFSDDIRMEFGLEK